MLQFFDTLTDTSGNALLGAIVTVTNFQTGLPAPIYQTNGTSQPIANSSVLSDITGQVSFYIPDGVYTLTYTYNSQVYKTRAPVQFIDPTGFIAVTDTGTANALVVTDSKLSAQKYVGLKIEVSVHVTNTGATTLNYQGDGGLPVNQPGGSALLAGMLQGNGLARLEWDGTQWELIGAQSQPFYAVTAAETTAGVTVVNTSFPPGHVYRYGTNSVPGTTEMSTAINAAFSACRQGGYTAQIPMTEILLVSVSLNASGVRVQGLGDAWNTPSNFPPGSGYIQANKLIAAFDVITSTGQTIMDGISVDGGWDGATYGGALAAGNILALTAIAPAHPYVNSFSNCNFANARRSAVFINRGGYTSFYHMHCLAAGFNGLELTGVANTDPCTSIRDYGGSQYSNTPYGYGISINNCVACTFDSSILEATNGIYLNGTGNRTLAFRSIYQEFQPTPTFNAQISGTTLTVNTPASLAGIGIGSVITGAGVAAGTIITAPLTGTGGPGTYTVNNSQSVGPESMTASLLFFNDYSGGSGLHIQDIEGINTTFPFAPGVPSFFRWTNVYFGGNDGAAEGPIPLPNRVLTNGASNQTISATGNATGGQISLPPGLWRLTGTAQTLLSSGSPAISQLACSITTNSALAPPDNGVNPLVEGADQTQSFGGVQDGRVKAYTLLQLTQTTTVYLRLHFTLGGSGVIAWAAQLRAELMNS